uniref:IBD domain-containing protein n=2 Tax=Macrostomum lignano TaxID=282301 RepID=A0A1I8HAB0_9PLAT
MTMKNNDYKLCSNNSMPMADKAYDAPEPPEDIEAFLPGLAEIAQQNRLSGIRPTRRNYATLYFRVRRRNYEQLLWQYFSQGIFSKDRMYSPKCLPYWTIGMKMRLRHTYPLGRVLDTMKQRLGINVPGIRFCLDGFFGMVNYTDIFGRSSDACPWMEISICSTVLSLRLKDGDSIFISIATSAQIERVLAYRKQNALEPATNQDQNTAEQKKRQSKAVRPSAASMSVDFAEEI